MHCRTGSGTNSRAGWGLLWLLLALAPAIGAQEAPPEGWPNRRAVKNCAPFPQPGAGHVTDVAGLLSPVEKEQLQQRLQRVERDSGVEVLVVTIQSIRDYAGAPHASIEAFARALFDRYAIGSMPANNGVLLLVAAQDRQVRIELGAGYGRSHDDAARRIVDEVLLPRFREGRPAAGIAEAVPAIERAFIVRPAPATPAVAVPAEAPPAPHAPGAAPFSPTPCSTPAHASFGSGPDSSTVLFLFLALAFVAVVLRVLTRSGRGGWGWVAAGLRSSRPSDNSDWWSSSSRSDASGADGFSSISSNPAGSFSDMSASSGGSAGGSSGGGGATGRW